MQSALHLNGLIHNYSVIIMNVGVTDYIHVVRVYLVDARVTVTLQQHALQHISMPDTELSLWGWDTTQTTDLATAPSASLVLRTSYTHTCLSSTGQSFPI